MKEDTLKHLTEATEYLVSAVGFVRQDSAEVQASNDHIEIIRHYDQMRKAKARIKEAREALDQMEEQWSREIVPDAMRAKQIKTLHLEGIGRVTISARFSASILEGKKEEAFAWLENRGDGGIIQRTVNSSTLSSYSKALFEKGVEMPNDLFKTGTMAFTSITKA